MQRLALIFGFPLFLALVIGQIGGIAGGILLALMLVPLLLLVFVIFATDAPLKQGWWSLLPLVGAIIGCSAGAALPQFVRL